MSISIITDWDNGQQDVWTTKIKPASIELEYASEEALKVCGYNSEEWEEAPSDDYGDLLVEFNLKFDKEKLKREYPSINNTNEANDDTKYIDLDSDSE